LGKVYWLVYLRQAHFIFVYPQYYLTQPYFKVIELLINKGADINSQQSYLEETPLHRICARRKPRIDIVELLLDRAAKVDVENISGKTPVFYCIFSC